MIFLIAVMLVFLPPAIMAQGTTSVLGGKVFDTQGAVIRNASVTVVSDDSGVRYTAKTNESGNWRVDALVAGHYHFFVTAPGFAITDYQTFDLQMADQRFIDVTLQVGNGTESVIVKAETPLVDTTAAVSGTLLNNDDMEEMPSSTNNPIEFVALTPGVFWGGTTGGSAFLWSNGSMSNIVTNGSGSGTNAMNYTIDGGTDTINSSGDVAFIPATDAVQEERVMTNSYDATMERTAAGTVNMMLKSGGKDFHGDFLWRDENNIFNANYYQNKASNVPVPTVHANEWGASFGGPLLIPKLYNGRAKGTFFFFNYDGVRNISPNATGTLSVPTAAEKQGDFSQSYTTAAVSGVTTVYPIQLYDPNTATAAGDRTLFSNAIVPSGRLSAMATALLNLMPLPNKASDGASTDSNNYIINEPKIDKFYSVLLRVDKAWNNNHHSYAEYRHNYFSELGSDPFGPDNIIARTYSTRQNDDAVVSHAWVISPSLLLTLIGNLTSYKSTGASGGSEADPAKFGFSSSLISQQTVTGLPDIAGLTTGLGDISGPSYENDYEYEGKGQIQQTWRNHALRYGAGFMSQQEPIGSNQYGSGYYNFTNTWTTENSSKSAGTGVGSTMASFLLGLPHDGYEKNNANAYYSQSYAGVYAQDDWRVTPRLTLNLGVRWDYQFPLTERHNQYYSRFDPNYNLTAITDYAQPLYASLIGGNSTNLGVQLLQANRSDASTFVARGAILYANTNGTSRSITDPQWKYVQPRIGFIYSIHPNTVLRGGIGRFVQGNYVSGHANQLGYSSTTTFAATNDNYVTPASTLDNPYPSGLVAKTGNSLGVYTSPGSVSSFYTPDIKRQYTDDVSLHLEQQFKDYLFEVGGVFEFTNGLVVGYQVNNPSVAAWQAAYGPAFDSTGRPLDTLPASTNVSNPFKGAPYITSSIETSSTISAYQLLRPNPLLGGLTENFYNGQSDHYALQSKLQRHLRNGFAVTTVFSWGKQMDKTGYMTNSVVSQILHRQLSTSDRRFQFTAVPSYVLPFGRGKLIGSRSSRLVDGFIGNWGLSANYTFYSGTPLSLPTNSAFFKGGDPGLGSKKTNSQWFDTSKFAAFPGKSVTTAQLYNKSMYPDWTGIASMPGYGWNPTSSSDSAKNGVYNDFNLWSTDNATTYGEVRNPYYNCWNIGLSKTVKFNGDMHLELRADAFNAFNHPQFGNIDVTASDKYFGYLNGSNTLSQVNVPRQIQLQGKFYF
jgi:hypothetical protein